MQDQLDAFVPHGRVEIEGAPDGPLAGGAFAVEDIVDAKGVVTGRGSPDRLASHAPARAHAPAVAALLDAWYIAPSIPGVAPRIDASVAEHEAVRTRVICITCIGSLGGLPEVSLPLARTAEGPVGLSLLAPRGKDAMLLELVAQGIGALRQPAAP